MAVKAAKIEEIKKGERARTIDLIDMRNVRAVQPKVRGLTKSIEPQYTNVISPMFSVGTTRMAGITRMHLIMFR
jgi:hypothetical protein